MIYTLSERKKVQAFSKLTSCGIEVAPGRFSCWNRRKNVFEKALTRLFWFIFWLYVLDDFSLLLFTLKLFSSLFPTIFSLKEKLSQKIRIEDQFQLENLIQSRHRHFALNYINRKIIGKEHLLKTLYQFFKRFRELPKINIYTEKTNS